MQLANGDRILRGRYRLLDLVSPGDPTVGLPMLWRVSDDASLAFAKIWRDDPTFPEVKSIWAHEVRSLLRLGGLPAAEEVFVRLRELGDDPAGFVVVLEGDGREPLSSVLSNRGRHVWLSDLRSSRTRRRLWQGLLRVGRGLAMMHAEGTLHRLLGPDSVFTDLDGTCDFRLSGFEWSLRVAPTGAEGSPDRTSSRPIAAPELEQSVAQYSVASDWFSFGLLCAEVMAGVVPERERLPALRKSLGQAAGLSPAERRLITDLIDPDPERRMWHASEVTEAIEGIVEGLSGDRGEKTRPLYVGFELGRESSLSKQIARVSGAGSLRDLDAKLDFVKEDLGPEPQISARLQPFPHYILHGAKINYQLRRWASGSVGSWEAALCTQQDAHPAVPPSRFHRFHKRRIEVRPSAWIAENIRSVRLQGGAWDDALPLVADHQALSEEQARVIGFLHATNQLEALLTVTQIWPIIVVDSSWSGSNLLLDVTPADDGERDELARLLGVPNPSEQMRRMFQLDDVVGRRAAEQKFVFGTEGRLSRREPETPAQWTFVEHRPDSAGPRYKFCQRDAKHPAPDGAVFLRPSDLAGSSVLLHRRKKAIDDLGAHPTILDAINDPASVKRSTVEVLRESEAVVRLDPSKQAALGEIWRSQPFYLLQGPPGTGKTTLVATMAAEQAATSDSAQILITAHSHATVDTALDEVVEALEGTGMHLAIRLDADKEAVRRKDLGRRETASRLASQLAECMFAEVAPEQIKARLRTLRFDPGSSGAAERGGFERLVEDGAAVVFATSNSGELARLLESGRRYDWSIVEEAGRTHGFDLALPLQASHRVLMIGDQEQLPPFNVKALDALLGDPEKLRKALSHGFRFAPTLIERYALKSAASDPERFRDDCAAWRGLLYFFRTMFERCARAGAEDGERITRQLVHQHRMHPHIRRIVADCFYSDLQEAEAATVRFATEEDPFETVANGWMPGHRIIFIDVPWVQRGRHAQGEETRPRYTAPVEVDVVFQTMGQFRPSERPRPDGRRPDTPTIQVLSPYRAQVNAIQKALHRTRANGQSNNIDGFEVRGGEIGATVDEFQGNQADVVVVSLVRNNHTRAGKGVGFLGEGARWNVLLSRAKRKLVLVGSWDFLWSRFPEGVTLTDDDPMADLSKVMHALQSAIDGGTAKRIRLEDLPPSASSPVRRRPGRGARRKKQ